MAEPEPKRYHGRMFVLLMLFFVLGPFGLPLLWGSARFSRAAKIALSAAVLLYTIFLVLLGCFIAYKVLRAISSLV
jgi:hypothetical protein